MITKDETIFGYPVRLIPSHGDQIDVPKANETGTFTRRFFKAIKGIRSLRRRKQKAERNAGKGQEGNERKAKLSYAKLS